MDITIVVSSDGRVTVNGVPIVTPSGTIQNPPAQSPDIVPPPTAGVPPGTWWNLHGPAVGKTSAGQLVDAQGRTAGPMPKPPYESEMAEEFRNLPVRLGDGTVYDRWYNVMKPDVPLPGRLAKAYFSGEDLRAACSINAPAYKVLLDATEIWPGNEPALYYGSQGTGSVLCINADGHPYFV